MTLLSRAFVTLLLFGLAMASGGGPASAHAVLLETMPAPGSLLAAPPSAIELRFNEAVAPIALRLIAHGESRVLTAIARETRILAALPDDLVPGSYLVSYRVVSADSHPVSGAFLFTIGAPAGETPLAPDLGERESVWSLMVALNRMVLLASLAFAAGGAIFAAVVLRDGHAILPAVRRALRIGALIAMASALLAVPLQGGLLAAAAPGLAATWFDGEIFRLGWRSNLGASATLIWVGLSAVALGAASPRGRWRALSAAGAVLAAGALAASGHAATAAPRWLAASAMVCHAIAMSFWAGSLWPLLRTLTLPRGEATRIIRRFSRWAVGAVIALVAAGLVLAVVQLDGEPSALVTTGYGQLLLLKLALVALLLLLAIHNKWRLTPALARGDEGTAERLAGAIRLEIATVGLILAVTALLGQSPPPRAIALAGHAAPAIHGGHDEHAMGHGIGHGTGQGIVPRQSATAESKGHIADATLSPARVGRNRLAVALRGPDGAPLAAREARVEFSLPPAGVEPLSLPLRPTAPGRYELTTDALVIAGIWRVRLIVLIDEFEQAAFDFDLPVR